MNRLSFITQFKIEFLISFTGCRKVLGNICVKPMIKNITSFRLNWQF